MSVLLPAFYIGASFTEGFCKGLEMADKESSMAQIGQQTVDIYFVPSTEQMLAPTDSISFDDGRKFPMVVKQAAIVTDSTAGSSAVQWISGISYFLSLVFCVFLVIEIVKFVVNINRGEVFVAKNVKRLRHISICFIAISLLIVISGVAQEYLLGSMNLTLSGYQLSAYWIIPWSNLLLGLLALLIAQVWSRGIALEEEQQFTV